VFVTCPLLVAACWAVLVKITTLNSVISSSFVFSSLARPGMQETTVVTPDSQFQEPFIELMVFILIF